MQYTAQLYSQGKLTSSLTGDRFERVMVSLLRWIEDAAVDAHGIILDQHGVIVQRCSMEQRAA